jgi:ribosome maturation factor RimP
MNPVAQQVTSLIEPVIAGLEYELVGVEYGNQGRGMLLRVYIDHADGITVDDCAKISRRVSALMDVEDVISGHYDLEVSSPGLDRPLFTQEQYAQFVTRQIKIVMAIPQMGRRRFSGELKGINDGVIEIEVDNEIYDLPLAQVASARLIPDV